jgi:hypothetical protein
MSRRLLALAAAAVLGIPAAPHAQDWNEGYGDGYDVSVDLNVQGGGASVETFQAPLQPYGDWVVVGNYGRVWRPRVAAGWRPYYYGRWEWTNEGWFWASDEPWGWAAYHYGRWAYDPYYSWVWVPGNEWAPAWVSWRVSGDAVGWAPLAPGFSAYVTTYPFVDFWWTFVPSGRFCSMPVHSVAYAPGYARRWYDATAPAPAFVPRPGLGRGGGATPAWGGPAPRMIEQHIGRPLAPVRIVGAPSPGARGRPGEIAVYRPDRVTQGRPAAPAPGFVGRGGSGGVAPGGRAPEYRDVPGGRAPEYRTPERGGRPPEYRAPDPGRAAPPPVRGGFGGGPGSGHGWTPPAAGGGNHGAPPPGGGGGNQGRGGWSPPAGGGGSQGHGGWSPPAGGHAGGGAPPAAPGGGHGGGGAPAGGGRGGGHGRGERH